MAAGVALCSCGSSGTEGTSAPEQRPHGYVEGAEETAEAQWRLVLADDSGTAHLLDPATEKVTEATRTGGITDVESDGRFAYLATSSGVRVFDSGVWTGDHGDHVHYYRAATRVIGEYQTGTAPDASTTVAGDPAITALTTGDEAHVVDRKALESGRVSVTMRSRGRAALAYAEHVLVAATDGADGTVTIYGRDGRPAGRIQESCPAPRGQAITRRGAVFGCADGALVVTGRGTELSGKKIAYPGRVTEDERAMAFHHRPGTAVLAAKAGRDGIWILNIAAGEWTRVHSGPAAAVSGTGEGSPVLMLGEEGRLRSYDPETGEALASTELIKRVRQGKPSPVIRANTARAYVNDPAANAVYEIDYKDDLRLARTFKLPFSPGHMVETGW
ncbi:hypothetical protein HKK74_32605 [Actinomadura alba]|uniref:ABC transporter n=1 Tax=Actinomadura alba TaxID=406431 RepID=A0ABR7LZI9_9ACTN|nr:hypothetical protein [Actinomadura alba]